MYEGVRDFAEKSALNSLLILLALAIAGFSISSFFTLVVIEVFFDLPLFSDSSAFDRIYDDGNIGALKFMQLMNQVGLFLLPGAVFMWLMRLGKGTSASMLSWFPALLVPVCALPIVTFLGTINEQLPLMEEALIWMRSNQEKANLLYEYLLVMNSPMDLITNLFIMAYVPAVAEETLFRGGLQQMIQRHSKNGHLAIWGAAFIFSLIHFQFLTFIPRLVMGAGLGYIFYWGGSLWMPILAHAINNAVAISAYYFLKDDPRMEEFDGIGQTLDVWVLTACAATLVLFYILFRFRKTKKPGQSPGLKNF